MRLPIAQKKTRNNTDPSKNKTLFKAIPFMIFVVYSTAMDILRKWMDRKTMPYLP